MLMQNLVIHCSFADRCERHFISLEMFPNNKNKKKKREREKSNLAKCRSSRGAFVQILLCVACAHESGKREKGGVYTEYFTTRCVADERRRYASTPPTLLESPAHGGLFHGRYWFALPIRQLYKTLLHLVSTVLL